MDHIYIDESGSMCIEPKDLRSRFFFLCLVRVNDAKRAKTRFKRFVSRNIEELKKVDEDHYRRELQRGVSKPSRMFADGKFKELKGNIMTRELKIKFAHHMCVDHIIELCLVKIDNRNIKPSFYINTARAFNYVLKLVLKKCSCDWLNDDLHLHLDNRNVKTNTVHVLKEYLITELTLADEIYRSIEAEYYQSENCTFIQIADIFANIHYSSQFSKCNEYKNLLNELKSDNMIVENFTFPKSSTAYELTRFK